MAKLYNKSYSQRCIILHRVTLECTQHTGKSKIRFNYKTYYGHDKKFSVELSIYYVVHSCRYLLYHTSAYYYYTRCNVNKRSTLCTFYVRALLFFFRAWKKDFKVTMLRRNILLFVQRSRIKHIIYLQYYKGQGRCVINV